MQDDTLKDNPPIPHSAPQENAPRLPVLDDKDCPNGDFIGAMQKATEGEGDGGGGSVPDGRYYLERPLFDIAMGDLNGLGGRKSVVVETATEENGLAELHDAYSHAPIQPGEQVVRLGPYDTVILLDTLKFIIEDAEERQQKRAEGRGAASGAEVVIEEAEAQEAQAPFTKFTETLGGPKLEARLDELIQDGVPPLLIGSLLELVKDNIQDVDLRGRIGRRIIAFATTGSNTSEQLVRFAEFLDSSDSPNEIQVRGLFQGLRGFEIKSILSGIISCIEEDRVSRETIAQALEQKKEVIQRSLGPGSGPILGLALRQVEIIAECFRRER